MTASKISKLVIASCSLLFLEMSSSLAHAGYDFSIGPVQVQVETRDHHPVPGAAVFLATGREYWGFSFSRCGDAPGLCTWHSPLWGERQLTDRSGFADFAEHHFVSEDQGESNPSAYFFYEGVWIPECGEQPLRVYSDRGEEIAPGAQCQIATDAKLSASARIVPLKDFPHEITCTFQATEDELLRAVAEARKNCGH